MSEPVSTKHEIQLDLHDLPDRFAYFQPKDERVAEQIQNWLFQTLDAKWGGDSKPYIQNIGREVVYADRLTGGWRLAYSSKEHYHDNEVGAYALIEFRPITMLSIVKIVDVVEINGKKYNKDAILSAIKSVGIKEVA